MSSQSSGVRDPLALLYRPVIYSRLGFLGLGGSQIQIINLFPFQGSRLGYHQQILGSWQIILFRTRMSTSLSVPGAPLISNRTPLAATTSGVPGANAFATLGDWNPPGIVKIVPRQTIPARTHDPNCIRMEQVQRDIEVCTSWRWQLLLGLVIFLLFTGIICGCSKVIEKQKRQNGSVGGVIEKNPEKGERNQRGDGNQDTPNSGSQGGLGNQPSQGGNVRQQESPSPLPVVHQYKNTTSVEERAIFKRCSPGFFAYNARCIHCPAGSSWNGADCVIKDTMSKDYSSASNKNVEEILPQAGPNQEAKVRVDAGSSTGQQDEKSGQSGRQDTQSQQGARSSDRDAAYQAGRGVASNTWQRVQEAGRALSHKPLAGRIGKAVKKAVG